MNIKEWIVKNLKTSSIVVEAGTCDGHDTLFFSDYFIDGKIYGFEPVLGLYNQTIEKVGNRKNVEILNVALSDKSEVKEMFIGDRFGDDWGASSFLKPKKHLEVHPEITFKKTTSIESLNLDEWFLSKKLNFVDFMWLDMQGYEPVVLKASPAILNKTKYIYTEVSLIETYENVVTYPEFKKFLEDSGFEALHEDLPWNDMGNVLFKNTKI